MNAYAIIILIALLGEYLLSLVANFLNTRQLGGELPAEFVGVYDPEAYRRSQEYARVRARFRVIHSTFDLAVILLFWFAGGFGWLDHLVQGWGLSPIWTGLAFIGILALAQAMLSLPFSVYSTFVIEERFGFNKTTVATFIADLVKGTLLAIVLGGPLVAGILALFDHFGGGAWIYCWLIVSLFILVMQLVMPTWIFPLFNKFRPLEEGDLRRDLLDYARSVDFSLANIFVMDGSKRSSRSNAFFSGFGKGKRVALFDTLIANHSVPELVAVVAHEIGHYKKRHIIQGMVLTIVHMGILFFLFSRFITAQGLFEAFDVTHPSTYAGLIFFVLLFSPIELVLGILMQMFSRKNEYEADNFAATTTRQPQAMIDALKKLSTDNLDNLTPHPFFAFLYYSHPPTLERIRALRRMTLTGA